MRPDGRAPRVKANLRREDPREEQPEPEERTLAPFVEQFFASPSSPKPFIFTVSSQYSPKLTKLTKNSKLPPPGFPRASPPWSRHPAHLCSRGGRILPANDPAADHDGCHGLAAAQVEGAGTEQLPSAASERGQAEDQVPWEKPGCCEEHRAFFRHRAGTNIRPNP